MGGFVGLRRLARRPDLPRLRLVAPDRGIWRALNRAIDDFLTSVTHQGARPNQAPAREPPGRGRSS